MTIARPDPSEKLAYGAEFQFVDGIVDWRPEDLEIGAVFTYRSTLPWIAAHTQAAGPVAPGVLLIEQAAQTALLLLDCPPGKSPRLGNIRATFSQAVPLDTPVLAKVSLSRSMGQVWKFDARLRVQDAVAATVRGIVALAASEW